MMPVLVSLPLARFLMVIQNKCNETLKNSHCNVLYGRFIVWNNLLANKSNYGVDCHATYTTCIPTFTHLPLIGSLAVENRTN
jgi:hypothetical protein